MVAQLKKVASFARSAIVSLTFLVTAIPIRRQECSDVAATEQSADWYVRPVGKSHRLNPRAIDSVEVPDESEDLAEPRYPMGFAGLEYACDYTHKQESLEHSSQTTSVARGNRLSNLASPKLPSLMHSSPACAFFIKARKAGTSFSFQCGCQMVSRQITGMPVRLPSCRARVVFPLPAQPKMMIRSTLKIITTKDTSHEGKIS